MDITIPENASGQARRLRKLPLAVTGMVWAAALYGVLQVRHVSALGDHSICGPWGCGPSNAALVAWNGFWLLLLAPPVVIVCRNVSPHRLIRPLLLAVVSLLLILIVFMGWQGWTWMAERPEKYNQYVVQHMLFSVATLVDLPLLPSLVAAGVGLAACWRRGRQQP